jgi:hypothetical protein
MDPSTGPLHPQLRSRARSEATGIALDAVAARVVRHDMFVSGHPPRT